VNVHLFRYTSKTVSRHPINRTGNLTIGSTTGKVGGKWTTIDEDIAAHNTNVLALSEDVQCRCLPSSTGAHKRGQSARLDVPINVVQKSKLASGSGNVVVQALPSQRPTLREIRAETLQSGLDSRHRARVYSPFLGARFLRANAFLLKLSVNDNVCSSFLLCLLRLVQATSFVVLLCEDVEGRAEAVLLLCASES